MYVPIPSQPSCARAWVAAASVVAKTGDAFNVVIDVETPDILDETDHEVISIVDSFLRDHDQYPVSTVVNTIFPADLYRKFGVPRMYTEYLSVFDALTETKQWGRYFERMIRHQDTEGGFFNPVQDLIDKLTAQANQGKCVKATHELSIYNPVKDRKRWRGGQCLSYLSFKRHPDRGLMLTAIYRNHTYISRCLGNLIGLARLQAFIASQAGLEIGPLTCISTHAEIDTEGWKLSDTRQLITQCDERLSASPVASS